jgi:hypothetical protein
MLNVLLLRRFRPATHAKRSAPATLEHGHRVCLAVVKGPGCLRSPSSSRLPNISRYF